MTNEELSNAIDKLITDKSYAAKLDSDPVGTLKTLGINLNSEAQKSLTQFAASKNEQLGSTNCSFSGYSC